MNKRYHSHAGGNPFLLNNKIKSLFWQIFRFGVVGVIAAAVHFNIVVFLVQNFLLDPLVANALAFLISFQMSYWGHRLWTFGGTLTLHRVALPKLLFVQLVNFAANETLFYIFLACNIPYPIALIIVLTILPIFTFLSSKLWIFR